jgi:hypothetical protein
VTVIRFTVTCDGKNSLKFECVAVVMHESSPWMLREEEGLPGYLTGRSSGRRLRSSDVVVAVAA